MAKRKRSSGGTHQGPIAEAIYAALAKSDLFRLCIGFRELPVGVDTHLHVEDSGKRIDYWAIDLWGEVRQAPHTNQYLIDGAFPNIYAIELKLTRNDFRSELRHPQKRRWALMYSNEFYFCAPKGLIKPQELPPEAGLLEYDKGQILVTVRAPFRDAMPPRWSFVASLLRLHMPIAWPWLKAQST
jgi:hypothetical protein